MTMQLNVELSCVGKVSIATRRRNSTSSFVAINGPLDVLPILISFCSGRMLKGLGLEGPALLVEALVLPTSLMAWHCCRARKSAIFSHFVVS